MMQRILKGETSGTISLALAYGHNYDGCVVEFRYQGAVRTFRSCEAGQIVEFNLTADETAVMALGAFPVEVRLYTADGRSFTVNNADVKIEVTDCVADVHEGGVIFITAKGVLAGIKDLPNRYTDADVVAKLREILRAGGAAVRTLLVCAALLGAALLNAATVKTAPKQMIYNDQQIVTDVTFEGLATLEDLTNAAGYVDAKVAAATNGLEGVGTGRQIIRGSNQYGPWDITVFNAQTAQTAQCDLDGRPIIDTYAEKMVVNDLHDQVNSLGDHYNELSGSVSGLDVTIGTHINDTNNPHMVTAAQVGALPIIGGTLTGNLALGEAYAGSRTLSIASDNGAQGIVLQGGTRNGEGGSVIIGGSSGRGGTFKVEGGGGDGGTMFVGGSPFTGGKLTVQGGGDRGGIIEVTEAGASIKKDGKEVATEAYVDAKVENAVLPTNPTFSNAVLAVGLNIDTDSVAVLNEIASTFGGFPIEGTATTVGGLLAALAAASAWLRRNKADKATTLSGYGITDAATKRELNALAAKVDTANAALEEVA